MDPRLLRAYNEELAYLRETEREFGAEHDVVAGYLGLKTPNDPDPYVERLLEGVAFLAARVKLKLNDEFPEFTQHLLQAIQPNYLSPTPSMCVVAFEPTLTDEALAKGVRVPRLTELTAKVPDHDSPCVFRTGHGVDLYPLSIEQAEYLPSRAAVANATARSGSASKAAPAPVLQTLGTGQPMLRSMRSAPALATWAAAERMTSASCPKSCTETGCSSGWIVSISRHVRSLR